MKTITFYAKRAANKPQLDCVMPSRTRLVPAFAGNGAVAHGFRSQGSIT